MYRALGELLKNLPEADKNNADKLSELFKTISQCSSEESVRIELCNRVQGLLSDQPTIFEIAMTLGIVRSGEVPYGLVQLLNKVPASDRATVCEAVKLLLDGVIDSRHISEILKTILSINASSRVTVCGFAKLLLAGITDQDSILMVLSAIQAIPADDQATVCAAAKPLLPYGANYNTIVGIFKAIQKIPTGDRVAVCDFAKPLLAGITDRDSILGVLTAIQAIPAGDRAAVCGFAKPLLTGIIYSGDISGMLYAIQEIPDEERASVSAFAKPLLIGVTSSYAIAQILKAIQKIPAKEREAVSGFAKSLLTGVTDEYTIASVLDVIQGIPADERAAWCAAVAPLLTVMNHHEQFDIPKFLNGVLIFSAQELRILSSLPMEKIRDRDLFFFSLFDQMDWDLFLDSNNLSELMENPEIRERTHERVFGILRTNPNKEFVSRITKLIFSNGNPFFLNEESLLFQCAVELEVARDLPAAKNPYQVFKRLKDSWNRDLPPDLVVPGESIEGVDMALNLATCQKQLDETSPILCGQLSREINSEMLRGFFSSIRAKINTFSEAGQQNIFNEIQTLTGGVSLDALNNIFGESRELHGILALLVVASPDAPADPYAVYLVTLLKFIASQPETIPEGSYLTQREAVLLMNAASIQGCHAGQKEGLAIAYRLLPNDVKLASGATYAGRTEKEQRVFGYIGNAIQEEMEGLLSGDNPFMHEVTETGEIEQLSHQSLYLKNLIAQKIGLLHRLVFDPYTGMVLDPLINKPTKEVLDCFLRYFTPSILATHLKARMNRELEAWSRGEDIKSTLYNDCSLFLNQDGPPIWRLDANAEPPICEITDAGALALLEKTAYIVRR
jgi:hypothetical protein